MLSATDFHYIVHFIASWKVTHAAMFSQLKITVNFRDGTQIQHLIQFGTNYPREVTFMERNVADFQWSGSNFKVTSSTVFMDRIFICRLLIEQEVCVYLFMSVPLMHPQPHEQTCRASACIAAWLFSMGVAPCSNTAALRVNDPLYFYQSVQVNTRLIFFLQMSSLCHDMPSDDEEDMDVD